MKIQKRKTVSARLSLTLSTDLAAIKEATGRPVAHLVASAMEEYLAKAKLRIGSVSHGTQRRQDLIQAFCAHLYLLNPAAAENEFHEFFHDEQDPLRSLWECARGCREWPEDNDSVWEIIDLHYFEMSLMDALDRESLEGMFFGAHPGDGSDYGFWAEGD